MPVCLYKLTVPVIGACFALFMFPDLMHAVEKPRGPDLTKEGVKDNAHGITVGPTGTRTTLLVTLPMESAWQDMAFLAAVPVATVVNNGRPSLIALDASGVLSPEIQDYVRRYRPDAVHMIGGAADGLVVAGRTCSVLRASSADEAACLLSAKFWRTSATAVICPEDDYEAGLVAAPLAARGRVPLLFVSAQGLSKPTLQELRRLQVRELIVVGKLVSGLQSLKQVTGKVTELVSARDVLGWIRQRGLKVTYLAAVNPMDRGNAIIKKVSLAGALLAAGRGGLIAPLPYEVRWKIPFSGTEMKGELPANLPKSEAPPRTGNISMNGAEYKFLLTGKRKPKERDLKLYVDFNGNGSFADAGEGPFETGNGIELGGKRYVITLGTESGIGKADVRLSWPTAELAVTELRRYYEALGGAPEHLCLVGFPDAVPQAIIGKGGIVDELTSDFPYANTDDDPFAEIGVARVIAENVSFATLYASRVLTYASLLDAEWQDRACQARWENTLEKLFENFGFDASYRHTEKDLKWIEPPSQGKKGKRAQTFEQDSPLARCAVMVHADHSWWHELGHTFAWDAEVLMAPVVVESGGCATGTMDREADDHSVIARLFRKGAVAFAGNARLGCAAQELQRLEFWNGVLSGQTIGQAHRRSMNSALVTILDLKQKTGGNYWYQYRIRTQFGDPAFVMRIPGQPRSAPARTTVDKEVVTVHAPAQWWPVKIYVPEDWKKWVDKDLFVLRGAGTYARRQWCGDGYDREETYVTAEFTTRSRVEKIEQVQKPPAPLGWNGSYYVDENPDGTTTYRWAVRLVDFDQIMGQIVNAVDRLDYRVVYQ